MYIYYNIIILYLYSLKTRKLSVSYKPDSLVNSQYEIIVNTTIYQGLLDDHTSIFVPPPNTGTKKGAITTLTTHLS